MKKIQKLTALVLSIFLLTGCAEQAAFVEPLHCPSCGEETDYLIPTGDSGDPICADCFMGNGYLLCRSCRNAYDPINDNESADGYCGECSRNLTWYCSICESRIEVERLADFGNGYYLCGNCFMNSAKVPEGMAEDLAKSSMYISRDEYLERGW